MKISKGYLETTGSSAWVVILAKIPENWIRKNKFQDDNYFCPRRSDRWILPHKASKLKSRYHGCPTLSVKNYPHLLSLEIIHDQFSQENRSFHNIIYHDERVWFSANRATLCHVQIMSNVNKSFHGVLHIDFELIWNEGLSHSSIWDKLNLDVDYQIL